GVTVPVGPDAAGAGFSGVAFDFGSLVLLHATARNRSIIPIIINAYLRSLIHLLLMNRAFGKLLIINFGNSKFSFNLNYSKAELAAKMTAQLGNGDALLLHAVAVANSDGSIFERLKIDSDTERSAYLILPSIKFTDAGSIVINGSHHRLKILLDAIRHLDDSRLVLLQRK